MLNYKADRYGREVIKINSAYTSQICSMCGNILMTKKNSRESRDLFIGE
ncbi:zinc ribbon domain-containing protein [Xanthovirga aplysinae]